MKKITVAIFIVIILFVMTGCVQSQYLSLSSDMNVSLTEPEYSDTEKVGLIKTLSPTAKQDVLPYGTVIEIEEMLIYHQSIFDNTIEYRAGNIEAFEALCNDYPKKVAKYSDAEKKAFIESLKLDNEIMTKASFDGKMKYYFDESNVYYDSGKDLYYVPFMISLKIDSFNKINIDSFAEKVASVNDLDYASIKKHYDELINFYNSSKGKYVTIYKGFLTYGINTGVSIPQIFTSVKNPSFEKLFSYKSDVWAQVYINDAFKKGYIEKSDFYDFKKPITRKQFAKLMVRYYESIYGVINVQENPFNDINDIYVTKTYYANLMTGVGSGKFDPNSILTREQIATVMSRYFEKVEGKKSVVDYSNKYVDDKSIGSWAYEHVYRMKTMGKMVGFQNIFRPRDLITIQEAVATICK